MKAKKQKKASKPKASAAQMKDLQPSRDARGGAQKKEDPDIQGIRVPL